MESTEAPSEPPAVTFAIVMGTIALLVILVFAVAFIISSLVGAPMR